MVTATLARRGTPWASKRSRSMLALSIMPWTRKLPHLKITRGGASWPARLPLGRTKRSTILVLSSTLTPWSVAPSSAVSNTRSKLTCISPVPGRCRAWAPACWPPAVLLEICTRRLVGLNCTSTRVWGTSVGLSPEVISPSWALVSAVMVVWPPRRAEDVGQVAAQPLPDGPHRHNAHRCHVAPCRAQRDLRLWRGPAARRSCQRLLGGQQPQPLVGDGQLLDGDLARLGVEFRAADLGRQAAIEHPARPHRPVRAHHVDHPVVARDGALAIDDALHPVPQLGVDAAVAVRPVEHAALEDDGLELGAADAAHRAVVATAFLVFLDVHLDLQPGAFLEGAAPVRRAAPAQHLVAGRRVVARAGAGWLLAAGDDVRRADQLHLEAEGRQDQGVSHGPSLSPGRPKKGAPPLGGQRTE